jgi:hypothetical protein
MNCKHLLASTAVSLITAFHALSLPVSARPATYNGASVYRDSGNNLYIVTTGLTPDQRSLRLFDLESGRLGRVDPCGVMSVNSTVPLTDIRINGTPYSGTTVVELPSRPWNCRIEDDEPVLLPVKPDVPLSAANTPSADKQVRIGNTLYLFDSSLRNQSVAVTYKGNNVRTISSECGLFVLRSTTLSPLAPTSQIQLGTAAPVLMSSLPVAPAIPQCRGGQTPAVYVPTTWQF